jgi:hypothetical protein
MLNKKDFTKIPIKDIIKIPDSSGIYEVMKNKYYIVTEDNCILKFRKFSIQCNQNDNIVKLLLNRVNFYPFDNLRCEFIETIILKRSNYETR